jgi:UDP-N-acetylmuramate dehydrogenase
VHTTLAELTTLRLGGPAGRVEVATSSDELVRLVAAADAVEEPVLLVGGGSNLVVGDDGWAGVVIRVASRAISHEDRDGQQLVTVDAGVPWDELVADTVADGLAGLETMSGIPGLTGATPVQNVGAYGSEVADVIAGLRVYDRVSGTVESWAPERCQFAFRSSAFKHTDRYVVLDVTFRLVRSARSGPVRYLELARRLGIEPGQAAGLGEVRDAVLELRRSKGMVLDEADHDSWSVGSFFVNPLLDEVPAEAEGCPRRRHYGRVARACRGHPGRGGGQVRHPSRAGGTPAELCFLNHPIRCVCGPSTG